MVNNSTQKPIDKIVQPLQRFIQQEKSGGLLLGISVIFALFLANSSFSDFYHKVLDQTFGFQWNNKTYFEYSIHHWINDGLMSIFFFVVGLELKREVIGGELSSIRKALLPAIAAVGGMVMPALIFIFFNPAGEPLKGWGIPMATDIAFALGVLYLVGNRIPLSLKVFLTALAIVDDLGAVMIIAFFYSTEIDLIYLLAGLFIVLIMYLGNRIGIRSTIFYAVLGIAGVWTCFLVSGVHSTIAAVLAAFTIPADTKISESIFISKINSYLKRFKNIDPNENTPTLTSEQLHVVEKIHEATVAVTPPLQRLQRIMYPPVSFIIIPIFAIANAGVSLDIDIDNLFVNNIAIGTSVGLLLGKVLGVVGFSYLFITLKIVQLPKEMNFRNLLGIGFLASIGFTMSLFITSLAFSKEEYQTQAKIGIFTASLIGGIIGYLILNIRPKKNTIDHK